MAAATVRVYQDTGSTGSTHTNVDSTGGTSPVFGTDDAVQAGQSKATSIQLPTATGTHYSANKLLYLNVTATGTTTISNRTIKLSGSPSDAHAKLFFKDTSSYTQGAALSDSASDGPATPSGYTAMTTSAQQWDNTAVATSATGKNGHYVSIAVGIDSQFTAGAGAFTLPNILLSYDEA